MNSEGHSLPPELPVPKQLVPAQREGRVINNVPYVEVPGSTPYSLGESDSVLLSYWRIFRRYKGTVLVAAFLGALTGSS